ncbi:PEP-CTERM/exosortase A-associated glycosyltransferase [compost metagenome]
MSKIWVVSEYTSSKQNSTGYFWEKAIHQLKADGLQVDVLTLKEAVKNTTKKSIVKRAGAKLIAAAKLAWITGRKARKGDVVFSGTNPETLLFALSVLRRLIGFRWYVLVHDVFPENLIPAGIIKKENIFYKLLKVIFDWVYGQPDRLFVIGRDMKELIDKKTGKPARSFFVHNWVDADQIFSIPKKDSSLIKSLGWGGKTVFQFFGNMGRVQGIPNILQAIDQVSSARAAFLFIGAGACVDLVSTYKKINPEKNVHYFGELPQEQKSEGLAACDVALISLESGMYGLGVPSKAYFSMAADRPILAVMDARSEISLAVEENDIGWSCEADNPEKIAKTIDRICRMDLSRYEGRSKNVLQKKYSDSVALAKLSALIQADMA